MEKKRPNAITIICLIGFLGAAISVPVIFSEVAAMIGAWYPPYVAFSVIVSFASMVGLWLMKKWSVIVYTALFVLNQIVLLVMGLWSVGALVIPAIVIAIGFANYSKMD